MKNLHDQSTGDLERYFFNTLMDNIPDRIYFKNNKGEYIQINKAAALRRGMSDPKEAINKTDFDFFTKEHAEQALKDEIEIIRNGKVLENIEEKQTWIGSKEDWASTTKAPIRNDYGEIIGTFGITRDITESKKAQEALEQSEIKLKELNAIKDKFFSIIAHDLRGPFNGLFGLLDMVREDFDEIGVDEVKENLETMNEILRNLFQLLEDLLEWGRIQRNVFDYSPTNENICQTIKNVVDLYRINAKNKGINLILNLPESLLIEFDKKMISTVIRNLLTNAIKFTEPRGTIKISTMDGSNKIIISVEDTGVGISNDNLHRLFNLTEYFSTKGTNNESGTGLGLILCKEFIEKHGGKMSVETELKKGSIFSFSIPKKLLQA
ncbi:MAG: PAS domain-containing sensor histidine kinase [Ignavibacteriaceae bacterium]|nr:PAS domain-containing sensor histidine kinase [Ignavibacteriaceae bacterium]